MKKIIKLSDQEVTAITTANKAITDAEVSVDLAKAEFARQYNIICATHELDKGINQPELSDDLKYLVVG